MRGVLPLCAPQSRGCAPTAPRCRRSAPPGDFPVAGKSPKARQGLCPLESPKGTLRSPAVPHPLDRATTTKIDRFATLRFVGKSVLLFLWFHQRNTLCFSIRGAVGALLPRMLDRFKLSEAIPLGQRVGNQGSASGWRVQEPGGSWRIFAYFLYARVGRSAGAERPPGSA